jgi:uroporphyrinogen decarboxylase
MKREKMTSRERVLRTLKRQPVDRMPIDLGGHSSTTISGFAYWNLRKHLGLSTGNIWLPDIVQLTAYVDEDIRRRFHLDCIMLETPWATPARWNPRGDYEFTVPAAMKPERSESGDWTVRQGERTMRMPPGGYFFDGAWLSYWRSGNFDQDLEMFAREAERIFKETPYAANFLGRMFGGGFSAFFGSPDRLVQMLDDPETVKEEHRVLCEEYIHRAGKIIERMGRYIQLLTVTDDMGMQQGPMCSPSLVEQCMAPYLKKFCDFIHRNSDIKVFMHNCGSILPLIPILIDCGVDVLNPVQVSARRLHKPCPKTCANSCAHSSPAAASCSARSTTFRATCRRRTSWPCSIPPTRKVSTNESNRNETVFSCPWISPRDTVAVRRVCRCFGRRAGRQGRVDSVAARTLRRGSPGSDH